MIGAIVAAGWKGYVQATGPRGLWKPKLPEALLPLPNNETVLSRTIRQLREVGATEVFVAIGVPGKSSPVYEGWLQRGGYGGVSYGGQGIPLDVEIGAEIWTEERLQYVAGLECRVVSMPDFDTTRCNYTTARLIQTILESGLGFDKLLITMGDYVMTDDALEKVLALESPCMWCAIPHHQAWSLNVEAATRLSKHLLTDDLSFSEWDVFAAGVEKQGIAIVDNLLSSMEEFVEIEDQERYKYALKIAK